MDASAEKAGSEPDQNQKAGVFPAPGLSGKVGIEGLGEATFLWG